MPKINEILLELEGFRYAMLLDLNMGYYHIQLSENASNLCTIIIPQGKYWYKRLSMGVSNSPAIYQHKMNDLFYGFEFIRAYIDGLLIKGHYLKNWNGILRFLGNTRWRQTHKKKDRRHN